MEVVSQCLSSETASSGLRVTCIQPGNVETPLLSTSTDVNALKAYGEPSGAKVLEPTSGEDFNVQMTSVVNVLIPT